MEIEIHKKTKDSTATHSSHSASSSKTKKSSYRIPKLYNPCINEDLFEKQRVRII